MNITQLIDELKRYVEGLLLQYETVSPSDYKSFWDLNMLNISFGSNQRQ